MKTEKVDFAIVTALEIECKAVLNCLDRYKTIQEDNERTYYHGYINLPERQERYEIVVVLLPEMGNVDAGVVATQIIERWQPLNIIMVGIAGGICSQVKPGELVVAKYVFYYELAKLVREGDIIRPRQYPCDPLLYDRCRHLTLNWASEISTKLPNLHFGPIASGEKVVANGEVLSILRSYCPELKAVGMEGAGIARAATLAVLDHHRTRFLEIRGISDCADSEKNDDYHEYAANAAANFTRALLRSRPFTPFKTNFLEKLGFFSFCRGVLSLITKFLLSERQGNSTPQESPEEKEVLQTVTQPESLKGQETLQTATQPEPSEEQEILQTLTQLMERFGLSEQVKPRDEFIQYDRSSLKFIQQAQTKLKRLSSEHPTYHKILIMLSCVLSATGDLANIEKAEYWFSQVRDKSPNKNEQALASFNLFQLRLRRKSYAAALGDLKIAIDIDQQYALHDIHKYPMESILGAGGMGCVFLCKNLLIPDKRVVVKCLWESRKGSHNEVFKEAFTLSKMDGQYILKPLDYGYVDNVKQEKAFFVTEYIEGVIDGATWLEQQGKLEVETGLHVGLQIAEGLKNAHHKGIYHLDLKPANILLKQTHTKMVVKIIDFGLSHVATSLRQQAATRQSQKGLSHFGQKVFGTLDYASPEQLGAMQYGKPSAKSDIFAFGATMYHLLTGKKPNRFIERDLPDIPELRDLLNSCLKEEPSQRPESVQELVCYLKQIIEPPQHGLYYEHSVLQEHRSAVWLVAFSPDSRILASGSNDGTIILWEVNTRQVLHTLRLPKSKKSLYSLAFSPDSHILASGSKDGTVKLWDVNTGEILQTLQQHEDKIHSVVFNPTKRILASSSNDKTILWEVVDTNTTRELQILPGYESIAFSPNGNILALASNDGMVKLQPVGTSNQQILAPQLQHETSVKTLTFSPYGSLLTSGSNNVILWNVNTGKKLWVMHENDVRSITFSPDGSILAFSRNNTIKLLNVNTGEIVQILKGDEKLVLFVAFSPSGRFLASGNMGKTIKLWERK